MNGSKVSGRAASMPVGIGMSAVVALVWTVIGAAITAWLVNKEFVGEQAIGYGALCTLMSGGFLSAKYSYHRIKHRRTYVMSISGCIYFLCMLAINAFFFGGQYAGVGVTAAAIGAGSVCGILLGKGRGKMKYPHKYKMHKP